MLKLNPAYKGLTLFLISLILSFEYNYYFNFGIFFVSDSHARTSPLQENSGDLSESEVGYITTLLTSSKAKKDVYKRQTGISMIWIELLNGLKLFH